MLSHQPAVVHLLFVRLATGLRAYAEGCLNERISNVLAAHEHAFAHFSRRCQTILYDRRRIAVLGSEGNQAR